MWARRDDVRRFSEEMLHADQVNLAIEIHAKALKYRFGGAHRSWAGLDGFWIHRVLQGEGVESHVVDPASILAH
jgi:hypothetical protein